MTQSQLAANVGISQQLLSKLESEERKLSAERAITFAKILECQPAELLPALAMSPQPETKTIEELRLLAMYRDLPTDQQRILFDLAKLMTREFETRAPEI